MLSSFEKESKTINGKDVDVNLLKWFKFEGDFNAAKAHLSNCNVIFFDVHRTFDDETPSKGLVLVEFASQDAAGLVEKIDGFTKCVNRRNKLDLPYSQSFPDFSPIQTVKESIKEMVVEEKIIVGERIESVTVHNVLLPGPRICSGSNVLQLKPPPKVSAQELLDHFPETPEIIQCTQATYLIFLDYRDLSKYNNQKMNIDNQEFTCYYVKQPPASGIFSNLLDVLFMIISKYYEAF
jgi:hypothetical protein